MSSLGKNFRITLFGASHGEAIGVVMEGLPVGFAIDMDALNAFLTDLREFGHTVVDGKRRLRMHYVTQTGVNPPTFTFFVNHSDLVNDTYQRYVENRMRSTFDFAGTPIRLFFRKKEQKVA